MANFVIFSSLNFTPYYFLLMEYDEGLQIQGIVGLKIFLLNGLNPDVLIPLISIREHSIWHDPSFVPTIATIATLRLILQ